MLKTLSNKTFGILSICLLTLSLALVPATPAAARYAGTADCDNNAIIKCGVSGEAEARQKFHSDAFVRRVYNHFSIPNEAALTGMVKGRITKSGEIWVGNERLATGAVTAGRTKMGADEVQVPGASAWMRPPSRSFRSNSLEMLVKLNSRGEFMHGVIMSCGNPVQAAHKVRKPAPQPAPQKPKPQPKPTPQVPKQPELEISKDVQVLSSEGIGPFWSTDETEADPGDKVFFRITLKSVGDASVENIVLKDSLPAGVTYQPDIVLNGLISLPSVTSGSTLGDLIGDGIMIDSLAPGQSVEIMFPVTIDQTTDACETPLRNIATAKADKMPELRDDAEVKVCQPEEQVPPEQPEEQQPSPQVQGVQTPPSGKLPETGVAVFGAFSVTSFMGFAAYKLKEFYAILLR